MGMVTVLDGEDQVDGSLLIVFRPLQGCKLLSCFLLRLVVSHFHIFVYYDFAIVRRDR